MQNVYITRNEKQIQLTVDEIKSAWDAWEAELRKEKLDAYIEEVKQTLLKFYKEEVKRTLLKLSKENDDPKYEMAANNKDIIDEIAREIGRAIENEDDYDYDGDFYDWCFNPGAYGGFMHCYESAMIVLREKDKIKQTLLKLSKEKDNPKYEMAANNKDIIDKIARKIGRAIENGSDYDWCFNPGAYGGFMHCYKSAMRALREKDDINENY